MSKAFVREDADEAPVAPTRPPVEGPVPLTRAALARLRDELRGLGPADPRYARVAVAVAHALVVPEGPVTRAVLGARVTVEGAEGTRDEVLVSPEEFELTGEGCSVASPMGRALLGAEPGDEVVVNRPRGRLRLEVLAVSEP